MHARFTTTLGMPVTDESEDDIGHISGILIHPDQGKVEGFYVACSSFFRTQELFLTVHDITHMGTRVRVRHPEHLSPVEDVMRLAPLLEDHRTVLGQRVMTESGAYLGTCADVQFETKTFQLEWVFPKKWFRWMRPVSRGDIVQIKDDIIVRDPSVPATVTASDVVMQTIEPLVGPTASRVKDN